VRETNSRETADFETERARSSTSLPTGSPLRVAPRRDADQHPLQDHGGELIARREVAICRELDLARTIGAAHARAAE
jgi:hypothetical protein